jgi:hypothetical protein
VSAAVTITLTDTTAPVVTAFTIPATASALNVAVTTFTATDAVGVTGYLLTETSTPPSAGAGGWTGSAPTSYTFNSAGSKTLYAWAKDAAGNVSASLNDSVTITIADSTAPVVTAFIVPSTSAALAVPITTFTATDAVGVTGYMITENSTPPSAGAGGWSGSAPTTHTVGADGSYTLYGWAKDAAGNVSAGVSDSVTVTTADVTAPTVTSFVMPSAYTSTTVPVTTFTATDAIGVTGYLLTESPSIPSLGDSGWSGTHQTNYIFSSLGSKYVYAWARDAAGNISNSQMAHVTVYSYLEEFVFADNTTTVAGIDPGNGGGAGSFRVMGNAAELTPNSTVAVYGIGVSVGKTLAVGGGVEYRVKTSGNGYLNMMIYKPGYADYFYLRLWPTYLQAVASGGGSTFIASLTGSNYNTIRVIFASATSVDIYINDVVALSGYDISSLGLSVGNVLPIICTAGDSVTGNTPSYIDRIGYL